MTATRKSFLPLDLFLLALIFAGAGYIGYRVVVQLNYSWNWSGIWQYLFRYDEQQGRFVANYLVLGLLTTIRLSLYAGILALLGGLCMALARTSRSLFRRLISRTFIELMRNLPPLVIIFLVYFFLVDQIAPFQWMDSATRNAQPATIHFLTLFVAPPSSLSAFLSAVVTLAVFESAYIAEIIRSGIESVDKGQWEAAHALGLTRRQTLKNIILPQGFRQILPPLAGQFISLIKDSSIVSVISIQELTYQGTQLMASTYMTIEVWVLVALMYFLITFPCSMVIGKLEGSLARNSA